MAATAGRRVGPLLAAAGFAWFLLEWNNPAVDSPLAFTVGLALYASCPPLLGHAALAYPGGRVGARLDRAALSAAYLGFVALLGVLPALVFDPKAACSQCARNLLLVDQRAGLAEDLTRGGLYVGLASVVALVALAAVRLVRASTATRPVFAAAALYLTLVAVWVAASLDRGYLANGSLDRRAWLGQAVALVGLALALVWVRLRARRARDAVAHLVVELAASPPPGRLREALATIVGDPYLVLAYPLGDRDGLVDSEGRRWRPGGSPADDHRQQGPCGRRSRPRATPPRRRAARPGGHRGRSSRARERAAAAEVRARLEELRESRARIVAAADAERRRLERNVQTAPSRDSSARDRGRLGGARLPMGALSPRAPRGEGSARRWSDLRELAHGIFPAVLEDQGLSAAIVSLAEGASRVNVGALPERRCSARPRPPPTSASRGVARSARAPGHQRRRARTVGWCSRSLSVDDLSPDGHGGRGPARARSTGAWTSSVDGNGPAHLRIELPCG